MPSNVAILRDFIRGVDDCDAGLDRELMQPGQFAPHPHHSVPHKLAPHPHPATTFCSSPVQHLHLVLDKGESRHALGWEPTVNKKRAPSYIFGGVTCVSILERSGYCLFISLFMFCLNFFMSNSLRALSSSRSPWGSFRISLLTAVSSRMFLM